MSPVWSRDAVVSGQLNSVAPAEGHPGVCGVHRTDPRHWRLWSLPPGVLTYVLLTEAVAVTALVTVGAREPVTHRSLVWFAILTVASALHLEAAQGIERIREMSTEGSPYAHMQSVWYFAGVLLLPLPLLTLLMVISFTHEWF